MFLVLVDVWDLLQLGVFEALSRQRSEALNGYNIQIRVPIGVFWGNLNVFFPPKKVNGGLIIFLFLRAFFVGNTT